MPSCPLSANSPCGLETWPCGLPFIPWVDKHMHVTALGRLALIWGKQLCVPMYWARDRASYLNVLLAEPSECDSPVHLQRSQNPSEAV